MKLGMPTLLAIESIEDNILFANSLGLDFIELNLNFPYVENEIKNTKKIKDLLCKANLFSTLHFYDEADFGLNDYISKAYLKILKKYIKIAHKIGAKSINLHLNLGRYTTLAGKKEYNYNYFYDDYITRFKKYYARANKYGNKYNVILTLENLKGEAFIFKTLNELKGAYLTYDIGHDYTDDSRLKAYYFKTPLYEMHFHDAKAKKPHLAIGKGDMPLKAYFDLIKDDTLVVIEVKTRDDLISSVKAVKEWIK